MTAVLIVPVWVVAAAASSPPTTPACSPKARRSPKNTATCSQPVSGWQLAGIWPSGDFRFTAPAMPDGAVHRRGADRRGAGPLAERCAAASSAPALYVAVVLFACGARRGSRARRRG